MSKTAKVLLISIGIPVLYGILVRILFGLNLNGLDTLFKIMSITFLFVLPTVLGALSVYFSAEKLAKKRAYQIFFPWISVLVMLGITLTIALEGWACWLMVLPLFFVAASIGGLIGGYLKSSRGKGELKVSLLLLIPFLLSPLEQLIDTIPATYRAYTYIDIEAPAEVIWDQVTRVGTIAEADDTGWLTASLGFPRPLHAELNYEGVGAYREAVFTGGLVFHETVTAYHDNRKMTFTIEANTYDIPSTTLDEHILIGGEYFDVLEGTYELEELGQGRHRLHLYSEFEMNTSFNFYAGWWGKLIMKDIQKNILRVEKQRAENLAGQAIGE